MAFTAPGLYSRVRTMLPEMLKFLVVGGLGTVIDLGGAAVLHSKYHVEPLAAKAISVTLATLFTYLGSRFWTFKERENQSVRREAVLFFVLNVVGLLIAEAVIGLVTYVMGLRGSLEYNAASFIGTGLGTIFRFYAYRKWVFLAPEAASASGGAAQRARVPRLPAVGARPGVPRPRRRPPPRHRSRRPRTRPPGDRNPRPPGSRRPPRRAGPPRPPSRGVPRAGPERPAAGARASSPTGEGPAPRVRRRPPPQEPPGHPQALGLQRPVGSRRGRFWSASPGRTAGCAAGTPRTPAACGGRARSGRRRRSSSSAPARGRAPSLPAGR